MGHPRLEIDLYQLADDGLLRRSRTDGTGWDWGWADWQREWMDESSSRFAYRCLPLSIANQTGLWVMNPVGFTAIWSGDPAPGSIDFRFDAAAEIWSSWITDQFGHGIITWNTPLLFRTQPPGSRLLVTGPANLFKANLHPLTALIESDWMNMSFTMNWKIGDPNRPIRFESTEPIFQALPLANNVCTDLESAAVVCRKVDEDSEVARAYGDWQASRDRFHADKAVGAVGPDVWQKHYFHGRNAAGQPMAPEHVVKVRPPKILYSSATAPGPSAEPHKAQTTRDRQGDTERETLRLDDTWRRWIAENLSLGANPKNILAAMIERGLPPAQTASEIALAQTNPYFQASERLQHRLTKRDWLLALYRKLLRLRPGSGEIPRRHHLSRREFFEDFYTTNRPIIITGMMEDWPALQKWSPAYFSERFGDRDVEVQYGRSLGDDYETNREKYTRVVRFAEFLDDLVTTSPTNEFYMTANNNGRNKCVVPELWDDIVQVREYLEGSDPSSGFLWLGPAGTVTPFHHDLTNNLMAQVFGRKRVKIVPTCDLPLMANSRHVFSALDGRVMPSNPVPDWDEPQLFECVLNPGEMLFLPVGCMHFVEGLDISATITFTNFLLDNDFYSFYSTYDIL